MGGECGREGGGQDGVEWGGKWDNCNSIINKYIKKKKNVRPLKLYTKSKSNRVTDISDSAWRGREKQTRMS